MPEQTLQKRAQDALNLIGFVTDWVVASPHAEIDTGSAHATARLLCEVSNLLRELADPDAFGQASGREVN